nr:MAG TPA: hypothetical protein [Caudoviricetes sp.]
MTIFDEPHTYTTKDAVNKHFFKHTILTIIKGYIALIYFKFQNSL